MILLYSVSAWKDIPVLESPRSQITLLVAGAISLPLALLSQLIKGKHWCYLHAKGLERGCFLLCLAAVFYALYSYFPDLAFAPRWILITVLECIMPAIMVSAISENGFNFRSRLTHAFIAAILAYIYFAATHLPDLL